MSTRATWPPWRRSSLPRSEETRVRLHWGGGLLAAGAMLACCTPARPEGRALPLGTTLQVILMPGETHRYRVPLQTGRGLEVTAQQQSLDVALTLVDPGGKTVVEESRRGS